MPKVRASAAIVNAGLLSGGLTAEVADDTGILTQSGWNADGVITGLTNEQTASLASLWYATDPAFARVASGGGSILRDGPLAYYRCNASSGPLVDVGGHAFWGFGQAGPGGTVPAGATRNVTTMWGAEDASTALQLPASGNGVIFNDNFGFAGAASHSFDCWFKPSAVPGTTAGIATKRDDTSIDGWLFGYTNAGVLTYTRSAALTSSAANTTATLTAGTAYHVGFTYDATSNTSKIFINGLNVKTTVHTTVPSIGTTTTPFALGARAGGTTGLAASAVVSDAAVYDYAVSEERMYAHYIAAKYGSA